MPVGYVPERGDIVWLDLNPQAGHEQALVISHKDYNKKVGLALFCPITTKVKGYPFEVIIPPSLKTKGVILSDQAKSLDWKIRNADYICKLPEGRLLEVVEKLTTLLR